MCSLYSPADSCIGFSYFLTTWNTWFLLFLLLVSIFSPYFFPSLSLCLSPPCSLSYFRGETRREMCSYDYNGRRNDTWSWGGANKRKGNSQEAIIISGSVGAEECILLKKDQGRASKEMIFHLSDENRKMLPDIKWVRRNSFQGRWNSMMFVCNHRLPWVKPEIVPIHRGQGEIEDRGRPLQIGRCRCSKQGNLYTRLVVSDVR